VAHTRVVNSQFSVAVIRLAGELDAARRDEVRQALQVGTQTGPILVDFSDVPYADSTVIAELMRFRAEAEAAGRRIAVLIGRAQFARLLQFAGLGDAFALFDERGAALTYLTGGAA
jgi:anti-anti-sigma factor